MESLTSWLSRRESEADDQWWNAVLIESPNFVVIPSLGSMVAGWLLLVPKQPCLSFSRLPPVRQGECNGLIESTKQIVRHLFGAPLVFEHGPNQARSSVGCSVDHAHLHFVPCGIKSIRSIELHDDLNTEWTQTSRQGLYTQSALAHSKIYVEFEDGNSFFAMRPTFVSQLLRRVIATHLGMPDRFDWREFPEFKNIAETLSVFAAASRCRC